MTSDAAVIAWKTFLETTPPNVGVNILSMFVQDTGPVGDFLWRFALPEIELFCTTDDGPRRFRPAHEAITLRLGAGLDWQFVSYSCKNCGLSSKMFALLINRKQPQDLSSAEIMKLGEYPPFGAPISKRVAKLLGPDDLELYR